MNYDQISKKSALTLGNPELESIYQKFKNQLERLNGSGMIIVNRSIEGIPTGLCDGIFFDIERLAEICMEDYDDLRPWFKNAPVAYDRLIPFANMIRDCKNTTSLFEEIIKPEKDEIENLYFFLSEDGSVWSSWDEAIL